VVRSISSFIDEIEINPKIADNYREKSRDRIKEAYPWEHITDQYDNLFKKMIGKRFKETSDLQ
jgi:glycosyltransferase involved in cell wall biosynthesis